jgi:hypothetical protein
MPVVRPELGGVDRPLIQIRRALTAFSTNSTWPASSSFSNSSYGISGIWTLNVRSANRA